MQEIVFPPENFMKVIAAVLVSTIVFGGVVVAQTPDQSMSRHASADSPASSMANSDAKRDGEAERHIKELRVALKITPAEESQWNDVAETMRENAKDLDRAINKRDASVASATAIENLNSYADIAEVHASGVKKLASAFSGLYSAMSDEQKKEADEVFSHRGHDGRKVAQQ